MSEMKQVAPHDCKDRHALIESSPIDGLRLLTLSTRWSRRSAILAARPLPVDLPGLCGISGTGREFELSSPSRSMEFYRRFGRASGVALAAFMAVFTVIGVVDRDWAVAGFSSLNLGLGVYMIWEFRDRSAEHDAER